MLFKPVARKIIKPVPEIVFEPVPATDDRLTLAQFYFQNPRLWAHFGNHSTDEKQILYDSAFGIQAGANLQPNTAFEDTAGWSAVATGALAVEEHNGQQMLRISSLAAAGNNDGAVNTSDLSSGSGNIYRSTFLVHVVDGNYNYTLNSTLPAVTKLLTEGFEGYVTLEGLDNGNVRAQFLSIGGTGTDHVIYVGEPNTINSLNLRDAVIYGNISQNQLGPNNQLGAVLCNDGGYIKLQNRTAFAGLSEFTYHIQGMVSDAGQSNAGIFIAKAGEIELKFNAATRELSATVTYGTTPATCVTTTQIPVDTWFNLYLIGNANRELALVLDDTEMEYDSNVQGSGTRGSTTNSIYVLNSSGAASAQHGLFFIDQMFERALSINDIRFHNRLLENT